MQDTWWDDAKLLFKAICFLGIIFCVFMSMLMYVDSLACRNRAILEGLQHRYLIAGGCMVYDADGWRPEKQQRTIR